MKSGSFFFSVSCQGSDAVHLQTSIGNNQSKIEFDLSIVAHLDQSIYLQSLYWLAKLQTESRSSFRAIVLPL